MGLVGFVFKSLTVVLMSLLVRDAARCSSFSGDVWQGFHFRKYE